MPFIWKMIDYPESLRDERKYNIPLYISSKVSMYGSFYTPCISEAYKGEDLTKNHLDFLTSDQISCFEKTEFREEYPECIVYILDLDETLTHTFNPYLDKNHDISCIQTSIHVLKDYYTFPRPYYKEFCNHVRKLNKGKLHLFSAGSKDYVYACIKVLELDFDTVRTRSNLIMDEYKLLRKDEIIIDDSPERIVGRCIKINPWKALDWSDQSLKDYCSLLK